VRRAGAERPFADGTFGHASQRADQPDSWRYDGDVLAINGFLEWFFLGLLSLLVVAVTVFFVFMAVQFFRNPGRRHSRR
jgi:hypothetical protein